MRVEPNKVQIRQPESTLSCNKKRDFSGYTASFALALSQHLKLLARACRVAAVALQFALALGILAIGGTVFLISGHRTLASIHRTFLRL
jgi:hypothetical protein